MTGRRGLQAKMTATYVAVTAGAVLLTELVIFGAAALSPPTPLSVPELQTRVAATAQVLAAKLATTVAATGRLASADLGAQSVPSTPGKAQPDSADGVIIGWNTTPQCDLASASLVIVVSRTDTVLATSYPACYPTGGQGSTADAGAPRKVLTSFSWPVGGSGHSSVPAGDVVWAASPIVIAPPGSSPKGPGPAASPGPQGTKVFGMLYVEVPAAAPGTGGFTVSPALVRAGLVLLAVAIPAGLAFGLLSTRRLIRRLRRLAALSLEVADGGFERRLPVSGYDEVSSLEENFNRMAGQLQASLDARRQLAEANARHQERSRIARELHDSISQELFSLSVLAGGLRRTLPHGSTELTAVETMERTAGDTMREMQSLLLALRPVALDEVGLASAIEGVCHAYTERLGVRVRADLEPVAASPALEHALLRVTQEALANAVRHADADLVTVRLRTDDDRMVLEITDDGRGFDLAARQASGGGLGLRAIHDRVAEHGGQLVIDSAPGAGTRVRASFPGKTR
jgi:signal transduction histidine kinase